MDIGSKLYPTVARLAFDVFSIPSMSSECERAFSQVKKMTTDERGSLKPDVIEVEQCLKSSLRNGITNTNKAWQTMSKIKDEEAVKRSKAVHKGE